MAGSFPNFDWGPNLCGAATSTGASSFVLWWPVIWPEEERREWWSRTSSISSHALFSTIKVKKRNSGKCVYHDCWWFSSLLLWSCGSQSKKDKVAQANTPVITIYNPAPMCQKHCQRHNGPEGWVLLTKVTSLGHITSSYTNLDQTSSESRPSTNFKISTKHQHFDET